MKRFLSILLVFCLSILALSGCSEKEPQKVKIVAVKNTSSLTVAPLLENSSQEEKEFSYDLNIVDVQSRVAYLMSKNECHIAFVSPETAAVIYRKTGGKIKILSTISTGGYEIISNNGALTDVTALKGKEIYLLQRDKTEENLFEYILTQKGLDPKKDVKIQYSNSAKQLIDSIKKGNIQYALLNLEDGAEVKSAVDSVKSLNLTDVWNKTEGTVPMTSFCAITTNKFINENPKIIETFMKELEESVKFAASNSDKTIELAKKYKLLTVENAESSIYENSKIGYLSGEKMQTSLNAYYGVLKKIKPELIGKNIPDSRIYYIVKPAE